YDTARSPRAKSSSASSARRRTRKTPAAAATSSAMPSAHDDSSQIVADRALTSLVAIASIASSDDDTLQEGEPSKVMRPQPMPAPTRVPRRCSACVSDVYFCSSFVAPTYVRCFVETGYSN